MKRRGFGMSFFADAALIGILALTPFSWWECEESESPPPEKPRVIELEYHHQTKSNGYQYTVTLDISFSSMKSQLRRAKDSLVIYSDNSDSISDRRLIEDGETLLTYIQGRAQRAQWTNKILRKRHLFAVKGFLSTDGITLCNEAGWTVVTPSYDDLWGSFIACGDADDCYPSAGGNYHNQRLALATLHELGHLVSPEIPHCLNDASFHDGACPMLNICGESAWTDIAKLHCGSGYPCGLDKTYTYCNPCIEKMIKSSEHWPEGD